MTTTIDALKMVREIRNRQAAEIKGKSNAQIIAYFRRDRVRARAVK